MVMMLLWNSILLYLDMYNFSFQSLILWRTQDKYVFVNKRGFLMKKTLFKTFNRIVKYKKSESCVWKLCSQIGWRPHPVSKELVWPSLYLHIRRKITSVTSHQALTRETHFFCSYRKSCFFMCYKRILWNACARMCVSTWKFWGENNLQVSATLCAWVLLPVFGSFFNCPVKTREGETKQTIFSLKLKVSYI